MSIIIPPLKDKVSRTYKPLVEYGVRLIAVCGTGGWQTVITLLMMWAGHDDVMMMLIVVVRLW